VGGKYNPETNVEVGHSLVWKRKYEKPFQKEIILSDSALSQGWTYYIHIDKRPE
jgi:hypothetical protein